MDIATYILLFIVGCCLGSFLCCQARRLHYRHQKKHKRLGSRSVCLHCHRQLKWYDNIPVFSWLFLKGRCRYCRRQIGIAEFLSEICSGASFVMIFASFRQAIIDPNSTLFGPTMQGNSPITIMQHLILVMFFAITLVLIFLSIYDGLYGKLPTIWLIIAIILAVAITSLRIASHCLAGSFNPTIITNALIAVLILGGLYLLLYLISKGCWVGDGDWLLGTAIALALGSPWLALFALFIANFSACIVMLPTLKHNKKHKIHFGPFMVFAFIIVMFFANQIISML